MRFLDLTKLMEGDTRLLGEDDFEDEAKRKLVSLFPQDAPLIREQIIGILRENGLVQNGSEEESFQEVVNQQYIFSRERKGWRKLGNLILDDACDKYCFEKLMRGSSTFYFLTHFQV